MAEAGSEHAKIDLCSQSNLCRSVTNLDCREIEFSLLCACEKTLRHGGLECQNQM